MAKGQLRSNREKKKPKAEKNKRKSAPVPSVFERVRMIGKDVPAGSSRSSVCSIPRKKVRSNELLRAFSPKRSRPHALRRGLHTNGLRTAHVPLRSDDINLK